MMNKMAITALGIGAAYLMRNKSARNKIMKQFESFTSMSTGTENSRDTHSS